MLKNFFESDTKAAYSFFLGVVLHDEIEQILQMRVNTVVLGGRKQIREAMATVLKLKSDKSIVCLDEEAVQNSTALGIVRIYENQF